MLGVSVYRRLLDQENLKLLTNCANEAFASVVGEAANCGVVALTKEDLNAEVPEDFKESVFQFTKRFESGSKSEEKRNIPFHRLWDHLRKINKLGKKNRSVRLMRQRCEELPSLFMSLLHHRNRITHEQSNNGTEPQLINLIGTILMCLDLTPGGGFDSRALRSQCEKALIEHVSRAKDDEGDGVEPSDALPSRSNTYSGVQTSFEQFADLKKSISEARAEIVEKIFHLEDFIRTENLSLSKLEGLYADSRELEALNEMLHAQARETLDEEAATETKHRITRIKKKEPRESTIEVEKEITPSEGREKLREIRDRIASETLAFTVKPWENICMMTLVSSLVDQAELGQINSIDDWKEHPDVRWRYEKHREIMDRQLAEYGEEMIGIYASISQRQSYSDWRDGIEF